MFRPNDEIGPYHLVRKLGRGNFGVVWLAERRTAITTTQFALKLPLDEDIDLTAVKHEAMVWVKAIGHPNILPIIEADIYDNQIVIVSEYAPDGSLEDWLKRYGVKPVSVETAVDMTVGILAGLEHLHARQIIHRDLKPSNILLQGDTPRIADFGIAKVLTSISQSNLIKGTPVYMAPEAFEGKRSEQTDVWSAGVILYQLLTGSLPFPQTSGMTLWELMEVIRTRDPEPFASSIPVPLEEVVACSIQKNPSLRYGSAAEMRRALRRVAHYFLDSSDEVTIVRPEPTLTDRMLIPPARSLAQSVADANNRLLLNLILRCAKADSVRDYFHVGVIGYGENVGPAFTGALAGRGLLPISEVAESPARVEERTKKVDDGNGGLVDQRVKFPIWIDAVASGDRPMRQAMILAHGILSDWLNEHPRCFPPVVINYASGEPTDGNPTSAAEAIKGLASSDGNVLLFNSLISYEEGDAIVFPDNYGDLPDECSKLLFQLSSRLPDVWRWNAQQEGLQISEGARGFAFQADLRELIRFWDVGTRASNLRADNNQLGQAKYRAEITRTNPWCLLVLVDQSRSMARALW